MIILFFTCTHYCISIFLLLHIYNLLISSYTSFPISYRTQTFGVPKSLKDPHITRVLGTPGPHIPSDMAPPHPHITRDMGTGVPKLGGPHFTQTPDRYRPGVMGNLTSPVCGNPSLWQVVACQII